MSRIGKLPVSIPANVTINLDPNNLVTVKGPKGELKKQFSNQIDIKIEDNTVKVNRKNDLKYSRALHGLTRALLSNLIEGVSEGYNKKLEIVGVGYKAEMRGRKLVLNLGFSHPIILSVPAQISISTPTPNQIIIQGIDKELVGMVAAKIRSFRKPEPYKGKGVKYENEYIKRKAGKAAGK
ncbi:MAG: 50S ribosomal protein L6 [Calditrichaceae bacterium]|nr:50S ribosomal protein L6 [Calditrichaceae bacterium]MBN2709086.1 50S ribosomal protein L6 [Calditrichaceae bacterium]RQV97043.1 MAG: 50S ribosomal protein L6 [Calditrichota bacterium]